MPPVDPLVAGEGSVNDFSTFAAGQAMRLAGSGDGLLHYQDRGRGPAVLLGHVNATDGGPGVFAGLRGLVPGDRIEVLREDGSTAVFAVERGEQYAKDAFPTLSVYGNTEGPELRLITCDGYDPATGEFDDNYVVYAQLVD